jgi:Transposase DDE domain
VGANPVDRGKPGTKLQLVCDGDGLPLTAVVTAANVNDTTMFQAVLEDVAPIRTPSWLSCWRATGPLGPGCGTLVHVRAGGVRGVCCNRR